MTPQELKTALTSLSLSKNALARHIQVNRRTVRRWTSGESPIPEATAMLIAAMLAQRTVNPSV